ncbi:DUF6765 family protein [Hyalangium gracile]|uniref:DUF6765 family protein n=1 Tax=Hyalangium gracile TaxID=394092 RepID=UPI001CCF2236|nr:DUF6765 family protein [Hyalangium gracile]
MDIDFHYHATYVAARFAGYSEREALIIATAAQMIDENGIGVLAEQISVHRSDDAKNILYQYKPLPTFSSPGDIFSATVKKHTQDRLASVWSVFHFLPGNFELPSTVPARFRSERWSRRDYVTTKSTPQAPALFKWLCRPHSPLAMHLVNNCRDMVHQPGGVVARERLEPYFVGVTMHVFADTWAHQDFTGPAEQAVNDARGETHFASTPRSRAFPQGVPPENTDFLKLDWQQASWSFNLFGTKDYAPRGADASYTGHGRVGHWPDHSALIWKYFPAWKGGQALIRNNPFHYADAFAHLVSAMIAIRTNRPYQPFALDSRGLSRLCAQTGGQGAPKMTLESLRVVNKLLQQERAALPRETTWFNGMIDDKWDQAIAVHGRAWREAMPGLLGLGGHTADWYPGRSEWIAKARLKLKKGSTPSIDERDLAALDFFKFNYAAKLHYRTVKEQLLAWGQRLIGEWNDGSAYVEDFDALRLQREPWREKIRRVLTACIGTTQKQYRQQGLALLLQELDEARAEGDITTRLQLALTDAGESVYGLQHRDGGNTVKQLQKLLQELGASGSVLAALTRYIQMPSVEEWKEDLSYERFARRASDPVLVRIDNGLATFHKAESTDGRFDAAKALKKACDDWLAGGYTTKETSRRPAVKGLREAAAAWVAQETEARARREHGR